MPFTFDYMLPSFLLKVKVANVINHHPSLIMTANFTSSESQLAIIIAPSEHYDLNTASQPQNRNFDHTHSDYIMSTSWLKEWHEQQNNYYYQSENFEKKEHKQVYVIVPEKRDNLAHKMKIELLAPSDSPLSEALIGIWHAAKSRTTLELQAFL